MLNEALSAAEVVKSQLLSANDSLETLSQMLEVNDPSVALTVARGSSDHAANYFSYLLMSRTGIPVVSLPLSLKTLHHTAMRVRHQLVIAFSQSGRSPDLVETMRSLSTDGALTVAMVNDMNSPLAEVCRHSVPLMAWPEKSVAATKSYIATLAVIARLIANWQKDEELRKAINDLPEQLTRAAAIDWSKAIATISQAERMMVVGRGLGFAIALEAALKLKETSAIQAEAFSSAEIQHGPMALIDQTYPLLIFAPRGPEQAGLLKLADEMRNRGARVLLAAPSDVAERDLTLAVASHPVLDPILAIQTFYVMVAGLAEVRGYNPDAPRHLNKVTLTN
ncbi:MAG TPA: SIS domain-containing protein [Gammaproteobacteria bacterium]|nr:SIS domain-containing protein [Gammaproteobacteria bacterium]